LRGCQLIGILAHMSTPRDPRALVIIDMQRGINDPRFGRRNNPETEENIARLLAAWRAAGAPVVHVRHVSRSPDSVFWPGQPGAEFQHQFAPRDGEHAVEKNVPDAFIHTGLERWLRVRDIRGVVIVGVITNNSVEATARSSGNLGFDTVVVSDAAFTFDKRDYAGTARSAEEVHAMSLANLDGEYATIAKTQQVLDGL
jgi:nicotinamidase-related amidase